MADKIVTMDPTKPGVLKTNGTIDPNSIPLNALSNTGANNGDVIALVGGVWSPSPALPSSDTASNLGAGNGVFKSKVASDFQFKSLIAGANVTITNNANDLTIAASSALGSYALVQDRKVSGTNGGTFTAGAFRTRDLNTIVSDTGAIIGLAANQITLQAGTYRVIAAAPGYNVDLHQARLRNITDATDTLIGSSEIISPGNLTTTKSDVVGRFTIAAAKIFELQHYCDSTQVTLGFGVAVSSGLGEVYSSIQIIKE